WLVEVWADLAHDLLAVGLGRPDGVRDLALLDELVRASRRVSPEKVAAFLPRLVRARQLLPANVGPDLLLDTLVLAWPAIEERARR
ncbi:MAG TPA: hypothetical protein VNJ28_06275, partial [Candidatus Limnocylindrales bacterium]|nr:hypothetical protein [Candidatus Limnocylindrales bacterium]